MPKGDKVFGAGDGEVCGAGAEVEEVGVEHVTPTTTTRATFSTLMKFIFQKFSDLDPFSHDDNNTHQLCHKHILGKNQN